MFPAVASSLCDRGAYNVLNFIFNSLNSYYVKALCEILLVRGRATFFKP